MTWTITTTTTISASRAVTLAERIPSEPIKLVVLHPGTGAGGTVTIWDDLGRSVHSTRIDANGPRHEAEFYSDRSVFNVSAAIDGNATLDGAGASVYLVSREAPDASVADGSTSFAGPVRAANLAGLGSSSRPYDLVVFGATPGGLFSAIKATLLGASAVVLEATDWVGGMVSGGIANTDVSKSVTNGVIVGMADDFYRELSAIYNVSQAEFMKTWGYAVDLWRAEALLKSWCSKLGIDVRTGEELISVSKSGKRVQAIKTSISGTVHGKVFHDASYASDLLPHSGVTWRIGREASALYTESLAGIRTQTDRQFPAGVDPYVVPGDSTSGLLPGVMSVAYGTVGAADPNVQAFTYRFPLTKNDDRLPIPEPDNYDPLQYELLGRAAEIDASNLYTAGNIFTIYPVQGGKIDTNDGYCMSTNMIKPHSTDPTKTIATEYVEAGYERRREIELEAKQYILGLLKFLKTDTRIPLSVRNDVALYGLAPDEFRDYGNFPPQGGYYVREGRRIVGDFVLKQQDVVGVSTHADRVALVYYTMDSHTVRRVVVGGTAVNEGGFFSATGSGSTIPMRVLFPKVAECENLLVSFGASLTRMAFCTVRMEPIQMALGEAVGAIAAHAAMTGEAVQLVSYDQIKRRLGINRYLDTGIGSKILTVDGTTHTDGTIETNGTWSQAGAPTNGVPFVHAAATSAGAYKRFRFSIDRTGRYDVRLKYPAQTSSARNTATPVSVVNADGTATVLVNQNWSTGGDSGDWNSIGSWNFRRGFLRLTIRFTQPLAGGNVVDATINGVAAQVTYATSHAATMGALATAIVAAFTAASIAGVTATYSATTDAITVNIPTADITTAVVATSAGPTRTAAFTWPTGPSADYVEIQTSNSKSSVIAAVELVPVGVVAP